MSPELNWTLSALCVLVAAVVRGLTGFGFAAIAVVGLAMLGSLRDAVPLVLCLEVASSPITRCCVGFWSRRRSAYPAASGC